MKHPYTFKTNDGIPDTLGDIPRATVYAWGTSAMVKVDFSPATKGLMKCSTKKETRCTRQVKSSCSEDSESGSDCGNSVQGGMAGKNGDDGDNGDEKDVLVVDKEMKRRAV